jgi:3-oxoacyl-[acyl-carrier protein] reductase
MQDISGKTAIVTGAASGIGLATVLQFLDSGAAGVVAVDLAPEPPTSLAARLSRESSRVRYVAGDVALDETARRFTDTALKLFTRIDVLVNNAGVGHLPQPLEQLGEDEFDRILAVNVKSIYLAAKEVVPRFKAQKRGVILNIASTAGVSPRPRLTWYNASKGWVITATRSMAVELAPFGIRVCALNPVAGETPMLKTFMGEDTPEMRAKFLATIPIGRFSTPEDLGNAACFLCSDEASMITGVAMEVDGGRCI